MRVAFVGNSVGYSEHFLRALVSRSRNTPTEIAAVICPQVFPSRVNALVFDGKRRVESLRRALSRGADHGRGGGPWSRMHALALDGHTPIVWPRTMADPGVRRLPADVGADVVVIAGLNRILSAATISGFPPTFNIHPSLLPAHRGPAPEFWQLTTGDRQGGVSVHRVDAGVDTGPVVLRAQFPIEPWFDVSALRAVCIDHGARLMGDLLDTYPDLPPPGDVQVEESYEGVPTDADVSVPFGGSVEQVMNRARAVGWSAPLRLAVSSGSWPRSVTRALPAPSAHALVLLVSDPMPYPDLVVGDVGTVVGTPGGGALMACRSGVVHFRRVTVSDGR